MCEQIPDKNIFMMCPKMNASALGELPKGFYVRNCKENELDVWKAIHFDTDAEARQYDDFMTKFFNQVYLPKKDLFYQTCLFVCNEEDMPVGTCFLWKSYNSIWTVHWFKVKKAYEGRGIGRGLFSVVMESLPEVEFPVFLHTQPASFRAIKLYSDFGFKLITDPIIGNRQNDLDDCLPILQQYMPSSDFDKLQFIEAPQFFHTAVNSSTINEF